LRRRGRFGWRRFWANALGVSESNRDAILTALTAEHFVMQGVIGASVNEQQARASMFLFSVSGALVAIGIVAQSDKFLLFTAAVIPALYVMGLLTILRLVDVGMESLQAEITVAKIRRHYRSLGAPAESLFEEPLGRWPEGKLDSGHVIGEVLGLLTTAASMIACVNGFIGAAGIALLLYHVAQASLAVSTLVGVLFAIGQIVAVYVYQMWRINRIARLAQERGLIIG
jgi:uncharacterized membrane protein YciS (DUF1049 family)